MNLSSSTIIGSCTKNCSSSSSSTTTFLHDSLFFRRYVLVQTEFYFKNYIRCCLDNGQKQLCFFKKFFKNIHFLKMISSSTYRKPKSKNNISLTVVKVINFFYYDDIMIIGDNCSNKHKIQILDACSMVFSSLIIILI